MPPETTILMPSSTVMPSARISSRGTNSRNPEVGLGVVGRKTLTTFLAVSCWTWVAVSPVTKPIAQLSLRGYWMSTTSRNALLCSLNTVSMSCLIAA